MRTNRWLWMAAVALAGTLLAGCGDDGDDGDDEREGASQTTVTTAPPGASADMVAADGSPVGRVTFVDTGGRMTVEARLTNLPPGFHGFHIHAVGKCERGTPAFTTAGGHMVVGDQAHPVHAGDQPVLMVLTDRTAEIRFTTDRYRLSDLLVAEGRAVVVHANPDNFANIPTRYVREPDAATRSTGDAGDRIACGVVTGPGTTPTSAPAASPTTVPATTATSAPGTTQRGAATTTTAAVAAATLDCKTVGFTPNSEDAASSVKATGLTCAEAEAFVEVAGRQTSPGGPPQLTVQGYTCVRVRAVSEPLPQAFYECTSGAKKVTFVRS